MTKKKNYWLDLFTGTTWQEFLDAGGTVSGFRERRWKTVQQISVGDYLLCYLTGLSRFIGVLEVVSKPFKDTSPIWKDEDFPCRLNVKVLYKLSPETAVPVHDLRDRLSFFQDMESTIGWTGHFRGSPAKWKVQDGESIVSAIAEAEKNPVIRPVDPAKLARRPKALRAKIGAVTIPETDELENNSTSPIKESSKHTEIQWLLAKLGNDMGFDVWVARNDRGRQYNEKKFTDLSNLKIELPLQFDEATNKTIELIDVLWLKGNAIISAFEIESTTSIYSGLLRMSDLISMQPNLNIPLYLVAPDERREKVFTEVNRPTFSRLKPTLVELCRFIPFSALLQQIAQVTSFIRYLKPEFLIELSESCALDED